jgi:SAM-dependent methyltransferase
MLFDELTLYDQARLKLHSLLADRLPEKASVEATAAAYAYWVCTVVRRHHAEWDTAIHDYAERAARDADHEIEAEQHELERLRTVLRAVHANSWLLDIGAGWGRLSAVCDSLGWQTVSLEPFRLGTLLMQRNGRSRIVQATGEALPFPPAMFSTVLIGWVLHHDAPDLDAGRIVREAARVTAPGGCLVSIEPLSEEFDRSQWLGLLSAAGFSVNCAEDFYTMPQSSGDVEQYALAVGTKAP